MYRSSARDFQRPAPEASTFREGSMPPNPRRRKRSSSAARYFERRAAEASTYQEKSMPDNPRRRARTRRRTYVDEGGLSPHRDMRSPQRSYSSDDSYAPYDYDGYSSYSNTHPQPNGYESPRHRSHSYPYDVAGGSGYSPVDPFQFRTRPASSESSDSLPYPIVDPTGPTVIIPYPGSVSSTTLYGQSCSDFFRRIYFFLTDAVPRQIYLLLLLRIPRLYFFRVTRILRDAESIIPEIQMMVNAGDTDVLQASTVVPGTQISPALEKFKLSWADFVKSLMGEWRSQNIIAALLLPSVLTMLQLQNVEGDPIMRTAALFSLMFALMSLLYGCIYMARFETMDRMHRAASWAQESLKTHTFIWWNDWIFLAMPAVWLAWSIISFIVCILAFIWRTGSTLDAGDPTPLRPNQALGPRIAITGIFALGFLYFILVMVTLRRYSSMDEARRERGKSRRSGESRMRSRSQIPPRPEFRRRSSSIDDSQNPFVIPTQPFAFVRGPYRMAIQHDTFLPWTFDLRSTVAIANQKMFEPMVLVDFNSPLEGRHPLRPGVLSRCYINDDIWQRFIHDLNLVWDGNFRVPSLTPQACLDIRSLFVADLVDTWNTAFFLLRGLELILSDEPILDADLGVRSGHTEQPALSPKLLLACSPYGAAVAGWEYPYIRRPEQVGDEDIRSTSAVS